MSQSGARWWRSTVLWIGVIMILLGVFLTRRSYGGYVFSVILIGLGGGVIAVSLARSFRAFESNKTTLIAVAATLLTVGLTGTAAAQVPQVTASSALVENRQWIRSLPGDDFVVRDGVLLTSTGTSLIGVELKTGKTKFEVDTTDGDTSVISYGSSLARDGNHIALTADADNINLIVHGPDGSLLHKRPIGRFAKGVKVTPLASADGYVAVQTCPPRQIDTLPAQCRVEAFDPSGASLWSGDYGNVSVHDVSSDKPDLGVDPIVLAPKQWEETLVLDLKTGKNLRQRDFDSSSNPEETLRRYRAPRIDHIPTSSSSTQTIGNRTVVVSDDKVRVEDGTGTDWSMPAGDKNLYVTADALVASERVDAGPILKDREPRAARFEVRSMKTGKVGLSGVATTSYVVPIDDHTALAIDEDTRTDKTQLTLYSRD